MVKQSIFGRMAQLAKANINSLLDQAEDPQKMLDQMVRDYTNNIAEAESAVAQTIGNLRMLQDDYNEDVKNAQDWGNKALAASRKADEYRAKGDVADAEKFDNLAKVALQRQMAAENEAKAAEPSIASQTEVVDKLKHGLDQMKGKLNELTSKRNELVARSKTAAAQTQVHDALKSIDIMDPTVRGGPLRREDPPRRSQGPRPAGARRLQPGRPVQLAGGPRRADRDRGPAGGAEVRRLPRRHRRRRGPRRRVHRRRGRLRQALGTPPALAAQMHRICEAGPGPSTDGRGPASAVDRRCAASVPCVRAVPCGRHRVYRGAMSSGTLSSTLVWLRDDLRLDDNPALAKAASLGQPLTVVYVLDEASPGVRPLGGATKWWLHHSLAELAAGLEAAGSRLLLRRGPAAGHHPGPRRWKPAPRRCCGTAATAAPNATVDAGVKAWAADAGPHRHQLPGEPHV